MSTDKPNASSSTPPPKSVASTTALLKSAVVANLIAADLHDAYNTRPSTPDNEPSKASEEPRLFSDSQTEQRNLDHESIRSFAENLLCKSSREEPPVFFDAKTQPTVRLEPDDTLNNEFLINQDDEDDTLEKHRSVLSKENSLEETLTEPVPTSTRRRDTFDIEDSGMDLGEDSLASPLLTKELIKRNDDEEKMVQSLIASATAEETIVEEDRVNSKTPLVRVMSKSLTACCCCSKKVESDDPADDEQ